MYPATRGLIVVAAIFGWCGYPAFAGEIRFPGNDPRTLLRVHSTLYLTPRPDFAQQSDFDRLISRGGGLVGLRSDGFGDERPEVFAGSGLGKPADLAALGEALSSSQVGTLTDCSLSGAGGRTGTIEITWYGRTGRRNTFVILLIGGDPPAESLCSPEARAVLDAIELFDEAAFRNP